MTFFRAMLLTLLCCAGLAWFAGPGGRLLVMMSVLLLAPGYILARVLQLNLSAVPFGRPALWLGLSLSVTALLYQWATAVGFALTTPILAVLVGGYGLGAVVLAWSSAGAGVPVGRVPGYWSGAAFVRREYADFPTLAAAFAAHVPFLLLLLLFGITVWVRFDQIADLVLPLWVDSVHHALMIHVTTEQGLVPYSLEPYLPVTQMPYHWGYHVVAAALVQLSGVSIPQTMLWSGQILNALHVLTCGALAAYLWRRPLAAPVAGLVVGLISIMPAYYVSWGRYTQLTGLLLLPALVIAWQTALRRPTRGWWAGVTLLVAGLSVIHFRVLIFALALMAAIALVWMVRHDWWQVRSRLWPVATSAVLSAVLTAPWLAVLVAQRIRPAIADPQTLVSDAQYSTLNTGLLWAGQNRLLVALALVAGLWGLWRRAPAATLMTGWLAALVMLANPWLVTYIAPALGATLVLLALQERRALVLLGSVALLLLNPLLVRVPTSWLITNDVVMITLFVPISVLIGGGACGLLAWLVGDNRRPTTDEQHPLKTERRRWMAYGLSTLVLAGATVWGVSSLQSPTSGVINRNTVMATEADLAAIDWVAQSTPADARFLINAAPWLPGTDRGVDGGYWLLTLTGRWISTPPALFWYGQSDYVNETMLRSRFVSKYETEQTDELFDLIERYQITHVYLSERVGRLTRETFADSEQFTVEYDHAGVVILAVRQQS